MMKATLVSLILLLSVAISYGQEPADALRYSYITGQGGTARNQAVGGAGASLGGEFTSLFLNPAGLGYYKSGSFILTPSYRFNTNESKYLGNMATAQSNKLLFNTSGLVISTSYNNRKVRSISVGLGFNRVADFNNRILYHGNNKYSSYSEKYLEELISNQVTDPNDAARNFPFGASMAINTYLVDTVLGADGELEGYRSLADPQFGLSQEMDIQTSGGITDASLGVGVNLQDKWFFGGSLLFPFLKYRREAYYTERDIGNQISDFNYFQANELLETKGVGINAKLGVIYQPMEKLRLGFAFHTPTFYQLTDHYNMTIVTDLEGYQGQGILQQSSADLNDGDLLRSRYNMSTPLRAILSGTYFFGTGPLISQQKGFITADVEYVNYKQNAFHAATDDGSYKSYYQSVNAVIDDEYTQAVNARLGAEVKFNTLMVRLGGAYYGNPYKYEDAHVAKITGGLGYRNKGFFADISYTHALQKDVHYPYILQDKSNTPAFLTNTGSYIALTIGAKL